MNARNPSAARGSATYHHGDLRQALLDAAQDILETAGVEGFTLRECARRAGVSHAAPAHHFGDAAGLLTAFATLGFVRMAELMQDYRDRAEPDGRAQLRAVGLAYLEFAIRHRAHFQLMFRRDRLAPGDAALAEASAASAGHLAQTLAAALEESGVRCERQSFDDRLTLAWSGVHGFATLLLEGRLDGWRGAQAPSRFAAAAGGRMLAKLEAGLLLAEEAAPPARARTAAARSRRA